MVRIILEKVVPVLVTNACLQLASSVDGLMGEVVSGLHEGFSNLNANLCFAHLS